MPVVICHAGDHTRGLGLCQMEVLTPPSDTNMLDMAAATKGSVQGLHLVRERGRASRAAERVGADCKETRASANLAKSNLEQRLPGRRLLADLDLALRLERLVGRRLGRRGPLVLALAI